MHFLSLFLSLSLSLSHTLTHTHAHTHRKRLVSTETVVEQHKFDFVRHILNFWALSFKNMNGKHVCKAWVGIVIIIMWLSQSCSCCYASAVNYLKGVSNQDLITPGLIQLRSPHKKRKKKKKKDFVQISVKCQDIDSKWTATVAHKCYGHVD